MRTRDVVILVGLVLFIIVLTAMEKYRDHLREAERQQQASMARLEWENRADKLFEERWRDLSAGLRRTLDSLIHATVSAGVSGDSLVTVMERTPIPSFSTSKPTAGPANLRPGNVRASVPDSLARLVAREYQKALGALPTDLNAYERRVATGEVGAVVRARFGLSPERFDSLLSFVE